MEENDAPRDGKSYPKGWRKLPQGMEKVAPRDGNLENMNEKSDTPRI